MSRESGTPVLDARSRQEHHDLHVKGAVDPTVPAIAVGSSRTLVPDESARIHLRCENDIRNAEGPFPSRLPLGPAASLEAVRRVR